jgi:hypothetical protein
LSDILEAYIFAKVNSIEMENRGKPFNLQEIAFETRI